MKKFKVIIVCPYGYCGGTLVLNKLCSLLSEKGVNAKLFHIINEPLIDTNYFNYWRKWFVFSIKWYIKYLLTILFPEFVFPYISTKGWRQREIPIKGIKMKITPFFKKKNTLVIYPEKVYGNFLNARHVMRWLLFHYPYSGDKNAYSDSDVFVCFRKYFNDWNLNRQGYTIRINYFDSNLYKKTNYGERSGNCYFIRKGANRPDLPKTFDGPILDPLPENEKVTALNRYQYCISYDTQTFYSTIAVVCGCISIVVPEPEKSRSDYLGDGDNTKPGIAYGFSEEEIDNAVNSRNLLLSSLDYSAQNEEAINHFFQIIEKEFPSLSICK